MTDAINGENDLNLEQSQETLFFPTSKTKLVIMSIFTFGIYEIYWFYKNWKFLRDNQSLNIRPFWRAWFTLFFCNNLFNRIKEYSVQKDIPADYNAGLLTLGYIALTITWKLPDPFWIVSILAVLVLLPVQETINQLNKKFSPDLPINDNFKGWNILGIILGVIGWLLVIVGMSD